MHFVMLRDAIWRISTLCHSRLRFNNGPRNTVFRCITPGSSRAEAKHGPCATEVCVPGSLLAQDACKPASHDAKRRMRCGAQQTRERNNIENATEAGELKTSRQRAEPAGARVGVRVGAKDGARSRAKQRANGRIDLHGETSNEARAGRDERRFYLVWMRHSRTSVHKNGTAATASSRGIQ